MTRRAPAAGFGGRSRLSSRPHLLVALLAATIVGAPLFSPAKAAGPCRGGGTTGIWTTIPGPRFDDGGSLITDHNVDPADADRIYATNGTSVYVTENSCDWTKTYQAEPVGGVLVGAASTSTIKDIVAPAPGLVVLMIEDGAGTVPRPRVVLSTQGGKPETWEEGGIGLPPTGSPDFLSPFPGLGTVLFMGIDTGGGTTDLLYASADGGRTFVLRSDLSKTPANAGIAGLEVDPIDRESLWAFGSGGLFHSTDGGRSFTLIDDFADTDAGPVDVFHAPGEDARILAFTPAEGGTLRSNDGGETWLAGASPPLGVTDSVVHGAVVTADQLFATSGGNTYFQQPQSGVWFDLNAPNNGTEGLIFETEGFAASVHTDSTIERLAIPERGIKPSPQDIAGLGIDVGFNQTDDQIAKAAKLSPQERKIVLKPGQERTITYELDLPQRYVPLDVYFLIDTSSSMTPTLRGLALGIADIASELEDSRIDVRFGLAEYRTYPSAFPPRDPEPNFVYRQLVDISPIGKPLADAINGLQPAAGGVYDAHMGALLQAATGSGVDLPPQNTPPGAPDGGDVPPGQQARFRQVALGKRVIIHATDEKFGDEDAASGDTSLVPKEPPDIPEMPEVLGALNAKGIDHVGLSIGRLPLKDLIEVSTGTATFAPEDGVDCDGNGSRDIPAADPLVCQLDPGDSREAVNLVEPVVSLLKAVAKTVPVGLEVSKGQQVVDGVRPNVYPEVILQTANVLRFKVTYSCTRAQAGKKFPVTLRTETSARLDLAVRALVKCKSLPVEEDPVPPIAPLVPPLVALVIPPPVPPPPPVTELSSASQVNAQSQAQAQGAAAHQQQEEPQFAYVQAYDKSQEQGELAMSSYRGRRGELPFEAALGAGLVFVGLMSATGFALRRRLRLQSIRRY